LISVAHEAGSLNDLRAILGNDLAIKAYREGKLPFPDGTIIARIAWSYVPSEENNKVFGHPQSFVAGPPTEGVQFMVKDSRKYASTNGWGLLNLLKANLSTRRRSRVALPATSPPKPATLSTPVMHLEGQTFALVSGGSSASDKSGVEGKSRRANGGHEPAARAAWHTRSPARRATKRRSVTWARLAAEVSDWRPLATSSSVS
jgi:hypothetical protein